MYERFTDRAKKVMQFTEDESRRFNHEYVGTEHILLGVLKAGGGVAAAILKSLDVEQRKIRVEVEKLVQFGPQLVTKPKAPPFTPRAKRVIAHAIEEAERLGHQAIGTQHLLLGLLLEYEGVACQVLLNIGVTLNAVRAEAIKPLDDDDSLDENEPTLSEPTLKRKWWTRFWSQDQGK